MAAAVAFQRTGDAARSRGTGSLPAQERGADLSHSEGDAVASRIEVPYDRPVDEDGSTRPNGDHGAGVEPPPAPDASRDVGPSLPPPPVSGGLREGPSAPMVMPRAGPARGPDPGAVLMLAGGVLTVVALFLPRFHVSGLGGERTISGMSGVGVGLLLLSGFAVARGLAGVRPDIVRIRFSFPVLTGGLMALLVVQRWSDLSSGLDRAKALGIDASIGIGFWLTVVGAGVVLAGGALMQFGRRRA
jgi:hypothetical protein